jgi:YjbE family integral membrane protein
MISLDELNAFFQVVIVDLVLAGDNAIVVGMVAATLAREKRAQVIMIGIIAATVLRIVFALATTQLMQVLGLTLAGGILLLWVCWKLWRELRQQRAEDAGVDELKEDGAPTPKKHKGLREAVTQIVVADVSMSLDNVLAVAGVAREHEWVLIFGLALSVAFMGAAATFIASLLKRFHWIAYVGLAIIFYVAGRMIWDGSMAVMGAV